MSSASPQPAPPVEQTTAAEPATTDVGQDAPEPVEPRLTARQGNSAEPRPSTLATQEVRLALVFTGGVSLAIWMGGVAREVDLLVQASANRRGSGEGPDDPATPDTNQVRRLYRRLLDVLDVQVAVDVLAGTSAGGINAAFLGLVNARRIDLGPLRDIWLSAGALDQLLRDPREADPPSLLKGDGHLLTALAAGIKTLVAQAEPPKDPRVTDVFITTTLLSPERSRFADDYGTQIFDTDHHGQFHFDQDALSSDSAAALALAARSSASFPAAFEPSFVPFGFDADPLHPDMSPWSNITGSHWAADGGLLVNRPIAPVLQSIFDRSADRQVRRALLYVVPSSGANTATAKDEQANLPGLGEALMRDLGATLNQSIAADLAAIKEHNDRTRAAADTRLRLAGLGVRLSDGAPLADGVAWVDYRERQGDWVTTPLVSEVIRQVGAMTKAPSRWRSDPGAPTDAELRAAAKREVTQHWPSGPPTSTEEALDSAASLGRPAFDAAKAALLHLLRLGYVLAQDVEQREDLATLGMRVHGALGETHRTDLKNFVAPLLAEAAATTPLRSLPDVVVELAHAYTAQQGGADQLRNAWRIACGIQVEATSLLQTLVAQSPTSAPEDTTEDSPPRSPGRPSVMERRSVAAAELATYLAYLGRADWPVQLLDLHVAVRSVLPILLEVEQPVELIQVSSDTRTLLASERSSAATKLTGMQVNHFGAFYKTSWRASDWMWGRVDGCGWLLHVLLDPRRILTLMENAAVEPGTRAGTFARWMQQALETKPLTSETVAELSFLDDESQPVPTSLPKLSLWTAAVLQRHIATEELPVVAAHMRAGPEGEPSTAAKTWLAGFDEANKATGPGLLEASPRLLASCPVPDETIQADRTSPLFLKTLTQAVAVATAAGTAMKEPPATLRPTFATARSVTRTVYIATDKTHGKRRAMALCGVAMMAAGVLAMLTKWVILGLGGLGLFIAGAVLVACCIGRSVANVLQVILALVIVLVAAAPWLPWLDTHVFDWLQDTAVPWIRDEKWAWPVLFFLLLLPPATTVVGLLTKRRRPRAG